MKHHSLYSSLLTGTLVLAVGCVLSFLNAPLKAQEFFNNDFNQYTSPQVYNDDLLDADFNNPNFENGVDEGRVSIVTGEQAFGGVGAALAVTYPAGQVGTRETGAQWKLFFEQEYEELFLTYRVKFGDGFDFVRGGKLPGLAGGSAPTGSTQATGFNGWAARLMWRTDFTGNPGSPEQLTSGGISYAKHVNSGFDQDGVQEDRVFWFNPDSTQTTLTSGVWYEIRQRVKMNTPGQRDGILQIWLDGGLVLDQNDIQWRNTADLKIDQLYFSTFYGGGSSVWETSKDEVAFFDDFRVSTTFDAIDTPDTPEEPAPSDDPPPANDGPGVERSVPGDFATIQAAVNASGAGDIINVGSGTFRENLFIGQPITINATRQTFVVAADGSRPAVMIASSNVAINTLETRVGSFGIQILDNLTGISLDRIDAQRADFAGIFVGSGVDGLRITNSQFRNNFGDGIATGAANNILVQNCQTNLNAGRGIFINGGTGFNVIGNQSNENGGTGIEVFASGGTISDNTANTNQNGIFTVGSDVAIIDNVVSQNLNIGLLVVSGNDLLVSGNTLDGNSFSNLITNVVNNSLITGNVINNSSLGAIFENSGNNTIEFNEVESNSPVGLYFAPSSFNNQIRSNSFRNNGFGNNVIDDGSNNSVGQ